MSEKKQDTNLKEEKRDFFDNMRMSKADEIMMKKIRYKQVENPFDQIKNDTITREPKSLLKNISNFWYHYKIPFIAVSILIIFATYLIFDHFQMEKYDLTVIVATKYPMPLISEYIETVLSEYIEDINKDGNVNVLVDAIEIKSGSETKITGYAKLTTTLLSGENILYLLDDSIYEYLGENTRIFEDFSGYNLPAGARADGNRFYIGSVEMFNETIPFFNDYCGINGIPEDLSFSVRMPDEKANNSKKLQKNYTDQKDSINNIIGGNKVSG